MLVSELSTKILRRLGEDPAAPAFWTDTEVLAAINASERAFAFLTLTLEDTFTLSLTPGQHFYRGLAQRSDWILPLRVNGQTAGAGFGPGVVIDPLPAAAVVDGNKSLKYRSYGPVAYGGAIWAFTLTTSVLFESDEYNIGIYKSTNNGATWVRQDAANAPYIRLGNYFWDGVSSTVTIFGTGNGASACYLIDFDMDTGLFGAPYGELNIFTAAPAGTHPLGITSADSTDVQDASLFRLGSGALRLIYRLQFSDGVPQRLYWRDFVDGVWTAPTIFPVLADSVMVDIFPSLDAQTSLSADNANILHSAVQQGDVIHCVFTRGAVIPSAPPITTWYMQILADGTFSVPVLLGQVEFTGEFTLDGYAIPVTAGPTSGYSLNWSNSSAISGDALLVPVVLWEPVTHTDKIGVLRGTPLSAPVWSLSVVATGNPGDMKIIHQAGRDTLQWFCAQVTSDDGGITWSSPRTTFSTPTVATTLSLGPLADGSLGLMYTGFGATYPASEGQAFYAPPIPGVAGPKLLPASLTDLGLLDAQWLTRTGTPVRYGALKNDLLFIDRVPAGGGNLFVTYAKTPRTKTSGDQFEIPEAHQHSLLDLAVVLLRVKEGGQELIKAVRHHLPRFVDAVKRAAAESRARALAQRYDTGPPELDRVDLSRLLKFRSDLQPGRSQTGGDKWPIST
jgi:hypothetical protein